MNDNMLQDIKRIMIRLRNEIYKEENILTIEDLINKYTNSERKNVLLLKSLLYLKTLFETKQYELAYQVVDILHVLPDVILCNNKKSKKDFWNSFIVPFEKKYNNYFFRENKIYLDKFIP